MHNKQPRSEASHVPGWLPPKRQEARKYYANINLPPPAQMYISNFTKQETLRRFSWTSESFWAEGVSR